MKPSKHLDNKQRQIWREIVSGSPQELTEADRIAIELLVNLVQKQRQNIELTANERTSLLKLLEQFLRTPASRNKTNLPPPQQKNEFDDL